VSPATYSYFKVVRSGKIKSNYNISSSATAHDHCRAAINEGIETAAG
jgi:hypothetical protein